MTSKHTPGPWKVSLMDDTVVVDTNGAEVAEIDGDYNHPDTWPMMEANARLIAAAPDLLSIAMRLVALPGGAWFPARHAAEEAELMTDARTVIAKVLGEE